MLTKTSLLSLTATLVVVAGAPHAPQQAPKNAPKQAPKNAPQQAPQQAPKKALSPAKPSLPDALDQMLAAHPIKVEDIDEPDHESLQDVINHLIDDDQGPDHVKIRVHFLPMGRMPSFSDLTSYMHPFPEMPQFHMPHFPEMPQFHMPHFPEMPQFHMPHFPEFHIPHIGHPSPHRSIPRFVHPSLPIGVGHSSPNGPFTGFGHPFHPALHMPKIQMIQRPEYIDTKCFMDSVRLCRQTMQAHDEHATRMCMMDHFHQVSPACQKSLKQKGEETSDCLVEACHSQINLYCKAQSILCEDTLSCMTQHRDKIATDPRSAHCVAILDKWSDKGGQHSNAVQSTNLHAETQSDESVDSFSHAWMAALMGGALALALVGAVSFVQRRREESNDQSRYIPVTVDDGYDEYN